jgi:molecular chaperone GrpE
MENMEATPKEHRPAEEQPASFALEPPFSTETAQPGATVSQITLQGIEELRAEMQSLREDFETKVQYDLSKERLIDTLHKELQDHREGLHFKILRPLFTDLISLYDNIGRIIESSANAHIGSEDHVTENLLSFQQEVEEILYRQGVETFQLEEETFVGNKQRVLKVINTPKAALDKHIARKVRKGFVYENRVLGPEIVEVYKYVPMNQG